MSAITVQIINYKIDLLSKGIITLINLVMSEELQKCSKCQCKKLLKFFKVRGNTGQIYKTCIICCERFKCELCEYKCATNCNLQKHIKQVHDQIKDFECEKCDYKCATNCNLQQHIKQVHDQIKDFECELCDYKCSKNSTLQRHILICKGENHTNISGLELRTKEALEQLGFIENEDYIFNSSYSKLTDYCGRCLRPDFRLFDHKIMIEVDGAQHFKPSTFGGISSEQAEEIFKLTQECDQIKNNFCEKFRYKMIRIKYTEIKDVLSILHYELDDIINV